jgi:uncharacterized protein YqfA (UPF0365 family)
LAFLVGLVLLVAVVVVAMFLNLWIQARATGIPVGFVDMAVMKLRRLDPKRLVENMIVLAKAGIDVELDALEAHVLSGGNLEGVADALIRAQKADLDIDFARLAAIDLAGRDIGEAVRTHVNPKVVACPPTGQGSGYVLGVCQDGIRLSVAARVTVRTRLDRLVGGAGEETIVARVGEGIVAAIGRSHSHKDILQSPEKISEYILARGLDSNTCFEILSVDIADVNVEDNIGARLQGEQADADKRVAQAKAEVRRAAAVAVHREMRARTMEMEGRVVGAKAVVPRGVAAAFGEANLGSRRAMPPTQNSRLLWRTAAG